MTRMHCCPVVMATGKTCGLFIMAHRRMCNRHWILVPPGLRSDIMNAAALGDMQAHVDELVQRAVDLVSKLERDGQ